MSHKCLLDSATKMVVNVIELEDGANWSPPEGFELAPRHDGNIGDTWDGTVFVPPPPPVEEAAPAPSKDAAGTAPDVIG